MPIPLSTYRLQLNPGFKFENAEKIVPYLSGMGISFIYSSPILKARKGSTHGYDVVEPGQLNPELGSEEDFNKLIKAVHRCKMKWLQDIVPNHMAYHHENQMLVDLLENGPNSRYRGYFDIEWNLPYSRLKDRILAPFLGKFFKEALESGELKLNFDEEGFSVNYWDTRLPLKMESYLDILSLNTERLKNRFAKNDPVILKYLGALYVLKSLPSADDLEERYSQIKFIKGLLWELYNENDDIKMFIIENLKSINGIPGQPESFNFLDKILSVQHFRLAFWKVANEEINYRRFFNVNDLISLRMENEETFNRTHYLILKLIKEGKIDGLRIDHVDGLYEPEKYLSRLRERGKNAYIVVEKILEMDERLPLEWPVEGTTGYEFLNFVNGIFCRRDNERKISNIYFRFSKLNESYSSIVIDKKRLMVKQRMAGEVERLAFIIEFISGKDRAGIDFTLHGLKEALEEILIFFPVYRTYISGDKILERDEKYIAGIIDTVKKNKPLLANEFEYIKNILLLNFTPNASEEEKAEAVNFVKKFQQLTGPLMAKGFEDTTLYIYNRLISLNDVGGKPDKFGIKIKEFHRFNKYQNEHWPHVLNNTSTHDTKRGEDVRARINVISELPDEWGYQLQTWSRVNEKFKTRGMRSSFPGRNDDYFLYQTLLGSYPFAEKDIEAYPQRIIEYMIKAVRESKINSNWTSPSLDYEKALTGFIDNILSEENNNNDFLKSFLPFQKKIAFYGALNSLSQLALKLASPGVPDIYQGCELWDFSLVDPDNRRPVDFELRRKYLEEIKKLPKKSLPEYLVEISKSYPDGRIKFYLTYTGLKLRNDNKNIFTKGKYVPLKTEGKYKRHVISFARIYKDEIAITAVPRFLTKLLKEKQIPFGKEIWEDTSINLSKELGEMKNVLTGEKISSGRNILIGDILKNFPVGFLVLS